MYLVNHQNRGKSFAVIAISRVSMSLTAAQVTMVQELGRNVSPLLIPLRIFYGKLFELDASLRALFPEDMSGQKAKTDDDDYHRRPWFE